MNFNVQIRRAAEFDLAAAQMWYENQVSGLGTKFHLEVSQVFARLAETPFIYSIAYRDVRRAVVHRFPYLIWYRILGKGRNSFGMHPRETRPRHNYFPFN